MPEKPFSQEKQRAVAALEADGLMHPIARTMAAAYLLQQLACTLFYDVQDVLGERGFVHHEIKRVWRNAETANDRLARTFAGTFLDQQNVDNLVQDAQQAFPLVLAALNLVDDYERITGVKYVPNNHADA